MIAHLSFRLSFRLYRLRVWLYIWLRAHPKVHAWLKRYGLAEVLGTLAVVASGFASDHLGHSLVAASLYAILAESIGYYTPLAIREAREQYARYRHRRWFVCYPLTVIMTIRDLFIEFFLAELLDTFSRPLLMGLMAYLFQDIAAGMIVGKLLADLIFYGPVIVMYLLKRRLLYAAEHQAAQQPQPATQLVPATETA